MIISAINAVTPAANLNMEQNPIKKTEAPKMFQNTEVLAAPSAELLRANAGIKTANEKTLSQSQKPSSQIDKDPYGARAYLNNHPVSPYVKGEDRENLINAMEKGNVETSNVEMQLALIADNKLTPQTLSHYWKTGKMCDQMEADIDMMYDCYANGKNVDDVYVPNVSSKEEGTKNVKIGDVFQVEGEELIYVKDDEDKSHQLKWIKKLLLKCFRRHKDLPLRNMLSVIAIV